MSRRRRSRSRSSTPAHKASAPVRFLRLVVGLLVLALVAWAVLAALTGDRFTVARLGIYIAPHLMLAGAGLAVLAVLLRAWVSAAGAALVAGGLFALFAPQVLRGAPDPATLQGEGVITVLTHSVRGADAEAFLRAHPADIIALQEVGDAEGLIARLGDLYGEAPLHHCLAGREMLLSRYPVASPEPKAAPSQLFCEVTLPGGPVLAASLHMPKVRFGSTAGQIAAFESLAARIDAEIRPIILAGDFNTTPLTAPYRILASRLVNGFAVAGQGLGASFPTPSRPVLGLAGGFLAIDHVFVGMPFEVLDTAVLSDYAPGADHFPVRAVRAHRP